MPKPRVTATDRLADVIEVVELGRRTGMLMVERGGPDLLEEGAIYFQGGRAIYAAVERVRGQDALSVLGGWGTCRFSFDPASTPPTPNISARPTSAPPPGYYNTPSPSQGQMGGPRSQRPANPPSWYSPPSNEPGQHAPSQGSSQTGSGFNSSWPGQGGGSNAVLGGGTNPGGLGSPTTNPNGVFNTAITSGSLPLPQGWSQPSAPMTGPTASASGTPAAQRQPARAEAALLRRPRRAPNAQDLMAVVQKYGLSRAHRTLLMLADGEHNVIDIARLSSKQIDEVRAMLGELEGQGLIYYY